MTAALNNLVQSSTGVKEYNVHFAGAILAALPTLLVYIVAGRYFVRGLMAGSVKGYIWDFLKSIMSPNHMALLRYYTISTSRLMRVNFWCLLVRQAAANQLY